MTTMTLTNTLNEDKTAPVEVGSVRNKGDRVCYTYAEDEEGGEVGYGTVIGKVDEDTAVVLVVLKGRRGEIRDEMEIPFSKLTPHLPDIKNDEKE